MVVSVRGRYELMLQCWSDDAAERPTFSQIKTYLERHLSIDPADGKEGASEAAAAYRPGRDGQEAVEMRQLRPASRNDYLSLRQSIPVPTGYLAPSAPEL